MENGHYENIQIRLSTLFGEVMHLEVPSLQADLFETGILDSQKFVELLLHIEQNFHTPIDLADFEIENFRSIEKIAALILHQQDSSRTMQPS